VLVVRGLERAIGISGNDPPVLQDLNFIRDAYKTSVPRPMLFILPNCTVTRLAKFAPDFWAWRAGVFQFKTTEKTRNEAMTVLEPELANRLYHEPVSRERIDTLERLLMEYHPSGQVIASDHVGAYSDILHQLGVAYLSQKEPIKASEYLIDAFKLAEQQQNLALQARVKSDLGEASKQQSQYQQAIDVYQQSLEIQRQIGDRNGEANSLGNLGAAYSSLGEYERAIEFYQQSLEIQRQIGDRKGEANSLGNLGAAYGSLGEYERAVEFYQQSLEITRQIGDRSGEASSLINLGNAYYSLEGAYLGFRGVHLYGQ